MRINPYILEFLREIHLNNNREWFAAHAEQWLAIKDNVLSLSAEMIERINMFDPTLGYLDPRRTMFRIARDTRFSTNKDPYKNNLGLAFNPAGSPRNDGSCYYVHIEPGASILAVGVYMPSPTALRVYRQAINDHYDEFEQILGQNDFRGTFGSLAIEGRTLQRVPAGFDKNSPARDYLRMTNFNVVYPVSDEMLCSEEFSSQAIEIFKMAMPLHLFLNEALKISLE